MTKEEIIRTLDGLKDYVNHTQHPTLETLKSAVRVLKEPEPINVPPPEVPVESKEDDQWNELTTPKQQKTEVKNKIPAKTKSHGTRTR